MTITTTTTITTSAAPISEAAVELLERSRVGLFAAARSVHAGERYVTAHLSALRAAAAVLATRSRPSRRSSGPRSVWEVLPRIAPELTEWAAFFAAGADRRAALEAGRIETVPVREADDQLRAAETFVALVESGLGLDSSDRLPLVVPGLRPAGR
jgi:SAV_6107-like HEPN